MPPVRPRTMRLRARSSMAGKGRGGAACQSGGGKGGWTDFMRFAAATGPDAPVSPARSAACAPAAARRRPAARRRR
ncbi:Uncharacterised protein [Bordetella pertussis]|nr:Uncharacterised protein [Bordetella pertussis]